MLTLSLPEPVEPLAAQKGEVLMVTNADLRESANQACWPVQQAFEEKLQSALERLGYRMVRAHTIDKKRGHGFISSQREGSDLFAKISPESPVIVLLTAWQYSHHLAPSLVHHKGPILRWYLAGSGWNAVYGRNTDKPWKILFQIMV